MITYFIDKILPYTSSELIRINQLDQHMSSNAGKTIIGEINNESLERYMGNQIDSILLNNILIEEIDNSDS